MDKRGQWKNQSTFILAAIGSAVGLGSIWRFPFICASNGGGAFLIAYITAMLIIGTPVLIIELSTGHKIKGSICQVFASIHPKFEVFGWLVLALSFVIISYYVVVMGWTYKYLIDAFTLKWGANTSTFFNEKTLGLTNDAGKMWQIQWPLLFFLAIAWISTIACIWRGPASISKIIHISIYIPAVILIIMVIRGITLDGSEIGLSYYLKPDFNKLASVEVWLAACTQVFFSLGTGMGVMFAYGSYLPSKADIVGNALIITVATAVVAFLSGLAVFSVIGFLSHQMGTPVNELASGGSGIAFIAYPAIINNLPFLNKTFGVLFFTMLVLLALNSAFSLVEAIALGLRDKFGWSYKKSNFTVASLSFIFGILFVTKGGIHWLSYFDYYASNFGIAISCIFNCIIIGWFFDTNTIINHIKTMPGMNIGIKWTILVKFFIVGLLLALLFANIFFIKSLSIPINNCPIYMKYITTFIWGALGILSIVIYKHKTNHSNI